MIRARYAREGSILRPRTVATINVGTGTLVVDFLIDTGADRTQFGVRDIARIARFSGFDLRALPTGPTVVGVGGVVSTRTPTIGALLPGRNATVMVAALLADEHIARAFGAPAASLAPPVSSVLGRDVLRHFALYLDERTMTALMFEPSEAALLSYEGGPMP